MLIVVRGVILIAKGLKRPLYRFDRGLKNADNAGWINRILIVDIEYRLKIVFVVWFGTHEEYDLIDAKQITYAKDNKK